MRVTYESEADLFNERSVFKAISKAWGGDCIKLKPYFVADAAVCRGGNVVAFVEVKCRTITRCRFPTYLISLHKLNELSFLSAFSGIPAVIVVKWSDEIGWWTVPKSLEDCEVIMGGTNKRNDPQDQEPVALIPIEEFKTL